MKAVSTMAQATFGSVVPGQAGVVYSLADMGQFQDGQAQYARVPFAGFNCPKLMKRGELAFNVGNFTFKGLRMGSGRPK